MTDKPSIQDNETKENENKSEKGEFRELIRYTLAGYVSGLVLGAVFDYFGLQLNAIGQWIVRTFTGEGESIFEGVYALRLRLKRATGSLAEAYGWGKLAGMMIPWIIDWGSRLLGVDVYALEGFYIPYFYALSDQIGASVSGFIFFKKREKTWSGGFRAYLTNPVMLTGLIVIGIVPIGLFLVRLAGFSPTTQVYTALETMVANLCWLPPLVGWLHERREKKSDDS
jgi:hypothetical protein